MSDPEKRKELQDMAKQLVFLHAEYEDLENKRRKLGVRLRAMYIEVDNELDKES